MAYVPNPDDASQPTGSTSAQTAAAEFRALKQKLNNLQGITVTWNPADASDNIVLSGGNLVTAPVATLSPVAFASVRANVAKSTGKWYFEVTFTGNVGVTVGIATLNANLETGAGAEIYSWALATGTGDFLHGSAVLGNIGGAVAAGSTVGIGFNPDTGDIYINSSYGQLLLPAVAGVAGSDLYPIISVTYLTQDVIANFGAVSFVYAPPLSYMGLFQNSYVYSDNPNLLINGNCTIDQLNNGVLQNPVVSSSYMTDGWIYFGDVAAEHQAKQNLDAVTPPAGYANYQGVKTILAYVPAAGEAFWVEQRVEGYNTVPLAFGNAAASPLTLMFQAYSSTVGVHSGVLCDGTNNRFYPFSYSIPVANTWTPVAIVIPGDIIGSWNSLTVGINMKLRFCLGAGANRKGVNGAWAASAGDLVGVAGSVNLVETLNAVFYYTGVELRRGIYTSSQPKELVTIEDQLIRCLRYYQKTAAAFIPSGYAAGAGNIFHVYHPLQVPMRQAPVVSTTFSGAVNCTTAIVNVSAAAFSITLTALAAGLMYASYDSGNTFDARL